MVTPKIHPTPRQTIYKSQFARNFLVTACEALYLKKKKPRQVPQNSVPKSNDLMFPAPEVLKSLSSVLGGPGAARLGPLCPSCVLGGPRFLFISEGHLIREARLTSSLHINLIS